MSCDLVGFQYRLSKIVRRIISHHTGVPIANISIHFTHSHSSPDMIGIFPNRIAEFPRTNVQFPVAKFIMKHMIRAGIQAFRKAKRSVKVGFGETAPVQPPLAVQRRPPYRAITDPIRIIKFTDLETNELLAILVNYQGHPTQLPQSNHEMSPEYPGAVAKLLYKQYPGLKFAAYFNGASGDVSIAGYKGYMTFRYKEEMEKMHLDWKTATKAQRKEFIRQVGKLHPEPGSHWRAMEYAFEQVDELGAVFVKYITPILDSIPTQPLTKLISHRRFIFPEAGRIKPIGPRMRFYKSLHGKLKMLQDEFVNRLRIIGLLYGYFLANGQYLAMVNIRKNGRKVVHQTEIQIFEMNDILWLASPGEPFTMYSDLLRIRVPERKAFFISMANDTCGYIFPWSFHVQGGYEQTFSFDMLYGEYLLRTFYSELDKIFGKKSENRKKN
jgi:hypothetical protein